MRLVRGLRSILIISPYLMPTNSKLKSSNSNQRTQNFMGSQMKPIKVEEVEMKEPMEPKDKMESKDKSEDMDKDFESACGEQLMKAFKEHDKDGVLDAIKALIMNHKG